LVVADAVVVHVGGARSAAYAEGIQRVSVAIAVPRGDARTATRVNRTRAVANAAPIKRAYTCIDVVANSILVCIRSARAAAHAEGIELISIAIAVPGRDFRAAAGVNRTRAIANPTGVKRPHTSVFAVADAILIGICRARAATNPEDIELVSIAIAIPSRNLCASTCVDGARSVADAAGINRSYTGVLVVANAIVVRVRRTRAAAHSERIAVQTRPVVRICRVIEVARVCIRTSEHFVRVTDAVLVFICGARTTAHAERVEFISVAIAVACRDARAATGVNRSRAVADATSIE